MLVHKKVRKISAQKPLFLPKLNIQKKLGSRFAPTSSTPLEDYKMRQIIIFNFATSFQGRITRFVFLFSGDFPTLSLCIRGVRAN